MLSWNDDIDEMLGIRVRVRVSLVLEKTVGAELGIIDGAVQNREVNFG